MSKLLYITEEQLQEIIGNGAYVDPKDDTNAHRLGGAEISVDGVTGNDTDGDVNIFGGKGKYGKVITDKIGRSISKPRLRNSILRYTSRISESNQDITGKQHTFQLSKNVIGKLKQHLQSYNGNKNDAGVKRAENLINQGNISYDNAYRVLDDMNKGNAGSILDPDGTLRREIENKIKTGTDISRNSREIKKERGENILKSTNKTGMKGGAHTPKGNNTIGVTYLN